MGYAPPFISKESCIQQTGDELKVTDWQGVQYPEAARELLAVFVSTPPEQLNAEEVGTLEWTLFYLLGLANAWPVESTPAVVNPENENEINTNFVFEDKALFAALITYYRNLDSAEQARIIQIYKQKFNLDE